MSMETQGTSEDDREAVLAAAEHAIALADWLDAAPEQQGTTTVAKSFSDILGETVRELNRLATCHGTSERRSESRALGLLGLVNAWSTPTRAIPRRTRVRSRPG